MDLGYLLEVRSASCRSALLSKAMGEFFKSITVGATCGHVWSDADSETFLAGRGVIRNHLILKIPRSFKLIAADAQTSYLADILGLLAQIYPDRNHQCRV